MVATPGAWHADYITAPAQDHYVVVPSDTVNFIAPFRGVYVGGAGNISIVSLAGTAITYTGVLVGTVLPVCGARVNATGTTATLLIGLV